MHQCLQARGSVAHTLRRSVVLGLTLAAVTAAQAGDTEPANDACETAISVSDGVVAFSTLSATTESAAVGLGMTTSIYNDVWYLYTPPTNGKVIITTCEALGGIADYDSSIAVYAPIEDMPALGGAPTLSCGESTYVLLGNNDNDPIDECGYVGKSTVMVDAVAGQTVLVRIGSPLDRLRGEGMFAIRTTLMNDNCADAIDAIEGLIPVDTRRADTDGATHENLCQYDGNTHADIWYRYVPSFSGTLRVSSCGAHGGESDFDTDIVVYRETGACPPPSEDVLGCNDDDLTNPCGTSAGGFQSTVVVPVTVNEAVLVRIGGYDAGDEGQGLLSIELLPQCIGDVNGDQMVDLQDLNLVLANFGSGSGRGAGVPGDANNDGAVDLADLNLVLANFGVDCTLIP